MKTFVWFSFLFVFLLTEVHTKSGGGRGGGGRGSSGARSSSGSHRSGGGKFFSGTSHSSYVHHGSSSFRSSVFGKSSNSYFSAGSTGNSYVINKPSTPIIYDNHHYYWHGHYQSHSNRPTVCEYAISEEDGKLMNVTFSNGTRAHSLMFGCGSWEKCCGLACCSTTGDLISISIVVVLVIIIFVRNLRARD